MKSTHVLSVMLLALAADRAPAAVVDSGAGGFTVRVTLHVQAQPAEVYKKFMRVGEWWNRDHTFSGSAKNLSIEEKAQGCFCEKLPDGGGVRHMEIVNLMPGKSVVLTGALGPMQALAVSGNLKVTFAAEEDGTKLEATYSVVGYRAGGVDAFAKPSDMMLTDQLTRLKSFAEAK